MDELSPRVIEKVGLGLVRASRLLVARSAGDRVFQIPGGKIEPDDADAVAALCREVREELGLDLPPETVRPLGDHTARAAGRPGWLVRVQLFEAQVTGEPHPCGEIAELFWLPLDRPDSVPLSEVLRDRIVPALARRGPPAS